MNRYFKQVLSMLKTRKEFKALGFSRKEQKGIAAKIADKLNLKEDASDDEISDSIDDAIDSIMPVLEIMNASADRRLNSYKEAHPESTDEDPDESETPASGKDGKERKSEKGDGKGNDDNPLLAAINGLTETVKSMQAEISALKTTRTADTRRSQVEEIVKNTGKFGERTLKAFSRMSFKDDDEFEDYIDELKGDLAEVNKERSQEGLDALGRIPNNNGETHKQEPKVMTADEIKELVHS